MSLHKINRVRVIRYLYSAKTKSGEMNSYAKIYDWHQGLINYYAVKYAIKTGTYCITVSSPIRRERILQNRRGGYFEFSK